MTAIAPNALNDAQQLACSEIHGPLLVLAGAGTGKTKVIVSRILNIIKSGTMPWNILAVTFTNKAAKEMKQRLCDIAANDAQQVNFGTFHSVAARILRSDIELIDKNFNSHFSIIDQDEQVKLVKDLLQRNNIDKKVHSPKYIHSIISGWKDKALMPEDVKIANNSTADFQIAQKIYHLYQAALRLSNSLDFDDLLLYNIVLFKKHNNILEKYQNRFRYILVDEYQDSNYIQHLWVRMLCAREKNICCVGDDDQSIYSWRGAQIANILSFKKDFPDAKIVTLEQNYRSGQYILYAASGLISHNKDRHKKSLWTSRDNSNKVKIISCYNDKIEASYISQLIKDKISEQNILPSNIAILVRASFQTRIFEECFIKNSLPYKIIGGTKFYDRAEIKDFLCYIRVAVNNNDNIALLRIINLPRRGAGKSTIEKIHSYASENSISLFHALKNMLESKIFSKNLQAKLQQLVDDILSWNMLFQTDDLAKDICKRMLDEIGYVEYLKQDKTQDNSGRIENLYEMINVISEFENIYEFLAHASLFSENESLDENFGGSVNLMTLHSAKGLEFDHVFLPGWEEGILPHEKSLYDLDKNDLEEERRIAYVGITRAKDKLYISYAQARFIYGNITYKQQSRFIEEIPEDAYEKINVYL